MDTIIDIARQMRPRSMAKKLPGTVKEILGTNPSLCSVVDLSLELLLAIAGTAQSVGCTVNGENPHDICDKVKSGEIEVPDE